MFGIIRKTKRISVVGLLIAVFAIILSLIQNPNTDGAEFRTHESESTDSCTNASDKAKSDADTLDANISAENIFGINIFLANVSVESAAVLGARIRQLQQQIGKAIHQYRNKLRSGSRAHMLGAFGLPESIRIFAEYSDMRLFGKLCILMLLLIIIYIFSTDGKKRFKSAV